MKEEELKALESLTSEIKELRKVLTVFASVQFAKIRSMNTHCTPTNTPIRGRMRDGLAIINEFKDELNS